ncbi:MAG: LUD domain-containing protein [Haloarculaceae archaeon]
MSSRRQKAAHLRHIMETEGDAVSQNARHINHQSDEAIREFERFDDLREETRAIKEDAIERLPELIDTVRDAVESRGGHVYLASDAADANEYIESVMRERDAEVMAKSKSMTSEELDLNDHLEACGFEVHETDLGEFVIQVADEAPSHLIGPAMHKTPEKIAELFNHHFDPEEPFSGDPDQLTEFAREYVGARIREADVGMTGANFIAADTGTLAIVTNEGNARKTAVTPDAHVAVAGVEKLIPTLEDIQPFGELVAKTGTGQEMPSYLSLLSPPVDTPTVDFEDGGEFGPAEDREFHLVLLDNGRMAMREDDDLRETLYCIRCGACANACSNFQSVGGHAFGGETYTGGIGTGWEAGVHGLEAAEGMSDLCTGCSRCVNKCPVEIDIPWINTVVRERLNRDAEPDDFDFLVEGLTPDAEPPGVDLQKRFFGNIETMAKLGSLLPGASNAALSNGLVRKALDRVAGIHPDRDLPTFADETLVEWFADRPPRNVAADREAVLYPDLYTNYFDVERGKAAVRVLEAMGVSVTVPGVGESGRAPLSQGMIETARQRARAVHADLVGHIDDGRDVVVVEPSDVTMFRNDYEKLLPEASFERLSEASYDVLEYVYGCLENGASVDDLATAGSEPVTYHAHCQQRTLGLEEYTTAVLEAAGYDVHQTDIECCGMAGSFGYKSEYYELAMDVGSQLEDFDEGYDLVASGTSCGDQLEAVLGRSATHPVELLDPGS